MIDGSFSLLPFFSEKSGGGYLYACLFDGNFNNFFGALGSQRFIFEKKIKKEEIDIYIHSIGEAILQYFDELPSRPHVFTCWNLAQLGSILIQCFLDRGFAISKNWTPEEKQIFFIESEETLFLSVNFGNKKIIKFYSLYLFLARADWRGIAKKLFPDDKINFLDKIPDWHEPEEKEILALADEARYIFSISNDMEKFEVFGNFPAIISAGGLSLATCRARIADKTKNMLKLYDVIMPPMLPEDRKKTYEIMHKLFENNKQSSISFFKYAGEFENISSADINSAYGAGLCADFLPFGPILEKKPEGKFIEIVFPEGIFEVKEGKIPILTFGSSFAKTHYHFEHFWNLGENANDFVLDGTLAFLSEEWKYIKNYYRSIGEEKITKKYVKLIKNEYIKEYIQSLYNQQLTNPERKKYFKSEIVGFFGKFIQNTSVESAIYYDDEKGIRRRSLKTLTKTPTFSVLGWYVASLTRIKILEKIEKMDLDDIVYIDTDAIYFKNFDKNIKNFEISDKIGDWKIEYKNCKMNFFAKKKYQILDEKGKCTTKCAGLPAREKEKLNFGDLDFGFNREIFIYERDKETYIIKPIKKHWVLDDQQSPIKKIEGISYE